MSIHTKVLNNQRSHISIKAKEHMNIININVNLGIHFDIFPNVDHQPNPISQCKNAQRESVIHS